MEAGFKATHKRLFMQLHKTHTYILDAFGVLWDYWVWSYGWMEEREEGRS